METILSFEYKWKTRQGIPIENKMLPLNKRKEMFEKAGLWEQIEADEDKTKPLQKEQVARITTDSDRP